MCDRSGPGLKYSIYIKIENAVKAVPHSNITLESVQQLVSPLDGRGLRGG
jgi:hypothetical protein